MYVRYIADDAYPIVRRVSAGHLMRFLTVSRPYHFEGPGEVCTIMGAGEITPSALMFSVQRTYEA